MGKRGAAAWWGLAQLKGVIKSGLAIDFNCRDGYILQVLGI
jgi:hypothetical protein